MTVMRILNPTAKRQSEPRALVPFATVNRRIGLLHNHSAHFDRLAAALPEALKPLLGAETIDTYLKERYSSGAPEPMLRGISQHADLAITGLAA
jgi:hypothetical protein